MKHNIYLILALLFFNGLLAQKKDILVDNSTPKRYFFNKVSIYKWDNLMAKWEYVDDSFKWECNDIYFGIPKQSKMEEFYVKYWSDKNSSHLIGRAFSRSIKMDGKCEDEIKALRINNYKNTQSSLEMNTESDFMGEGYLDTGEKCIIIHNIGIDKLMKSYMIRILFNDTMVSYEL